MQPITFETSVLSEQDLTIGGKKYVIREADAETSNAYQKMVIRGAQQNGDKVGMTDAAVDIIPFLVSKCLFEVKDDSTKVPVPQDVFLKWPHKIQRAIFEAAQRLSDIDQPMNIKDIDATIERLTQRKEVLASRMGK